LLILEGILHISVKFEGIFAHMIMRYGVGVGVKKIHKKVCQKKKRR